MLNLFCLSYTQINCVPLLFFSYLLTSPKLYLKEFDSSWLFQSELCPLLNCVAAGLDARNVAGTSSQTQARSNQWTELAVAHPGVKGDKRGDS